MAAFPAPPAGSPPSVAADIALGCVIALCFGQATYACLANRSYLQRELDARAEATAWYEQA